jgi:hypothetical protein
MVDERLRAHAVGWDAPDRALDATREQPLAPLAAPAVVAQMARTRARAIAVIGPSLIKMRLLAIKNRGRLPHGWDRG